MNTQRKARAGTGSSLARRLLAGAAWAFGVKSLGMASALIINALLARMLAPEDMGAYFLVVSIVFFAAVMARLGTRQTMVRIVAESMATSKPGRAGAALRHVYGIVSIGAILVAGGYFLGIGEWLARSVFSIPMIAAVIGPSALWIAILALQTPVAETFRGLHDIKLAVMLDGTLASILTAIALSIVWLNVEGLSLFQAISVSLACAVVSLVVGMALLLGRRAKLLGAGSIKFSEVFSISAPMYVTNLVGQMMANSSLWIVGGFLIATDAALYGAAWRLVNLVLLPQMLMNMSVQPVISELHAMGHSDSLQRALRGTATLAALPVIPIFLTFLLASEQVLEVVYGAPYREASRVLVILSVGHLVNVWTGSCGHVLAFTGHQKELMFVSLATGAASIALAIVFVKTWGMLGVAVAASLGGVTQNLVNWLLVYKLTGYWTHGTLRPSFLKAAYRRAFKNSDA